MPPSDDELDGEETGQVSRIRPRQSASAPKPVIKTRKAFYSDEHPEVPKIRRASLKQTPIEVAPEENEDFPEHTETEPHRWNSSRRKQAEMRPFTGLETPGRAPLEHKESSTRHLNQTRQKAPDGVHPDHGTTEGLSRRKLAEMRPFTGLEKFDEDELDTLKRESLPRHFTSTGKNPRSSSRISSAISPRMRQHASNRSTTNIRFFGRKKSWLLIGLLALVVIVTAPILTHIFSTTHTAIQNNLSNTGTQGVSVSQLQGIASNEHELIITPPQSDHPTPPIYATSAFLLDADSETTLYAQNPFLHLPMLSTTKLMTATLAVQAGNLNQEITITPAMEADIQQLSADSALFGVKEGQTYTLKDLLYGLLYVSGNDAALVIADALGGNVQTFVDQMNQKAQDLGLHDTHFVNPHGLLDPGQYSCARDLAVLGEYSLSIPELQQMSSGKTYQIAAGGNHAARTIQNENQFLWWYPGVNGGKTGYDNASDFIQVMSVTRNGRHMIGVVMHTNDWWTDMRNLMDYGSDDYAWTSPRTVDSSGQPVPYDNLWNYFASDTQQNTIPTADQGEYFIDTGYSVSGPILAYFNKQGGLDKLGFPTQVPVPSNGSDMIQQFQHGAIQCNLSTNQCSQV